MNSLLDAASALAVSMVDMDPDVGSLRADKNWTASVLAEERPGERRLVVSRGADGMELKRVPPGSSRPAELPPELPYLPNVAMWWGRSSASLIATWVRVEDRFSTAALLTAICTEQGWEVQQALLLTRPFPQTVTFNKAGRLRLLIAQGRQVTIAESTSRPVS